jgi:protein phosphatase 1L
MKIKCLVLITSLFVSMNVSAVSCEWGVVTDRNMRNYQEDRYTCSSISSGENKKQGMFFGIYDGHGGYRTSDLLKKRLHVDFDHYLSVDRSEKEAFERAFLDNEHMALSKYSDGSTVVAAYVDSTTNFLHYAWVGDSRLVVHNGPVTKDHKPDNDQEKKRIEDLGGRVYTHGVPRVNGLAVSRSIGDAAVKKAGEGQVIATPEYGNYQLTKDNAFMILASDGLWDVVDNESALMIVKDALCNKGCSCETAAYLLKNEAIIHGSQDNITIMVAKFDWLQK